MIRIARQIFSFSKSKSFSVNNFFTGHQLAQYTSLSDQQFETLLVSSRQHGQTWKSMPISGKEQKITNFINQLKNTDNFNQCSQLLSSCSGKEIEECEAELRVAIKILIAQLTPQYAKESSLGINCYRFEPFETCTSIFDHRHPLLSALTYLGLAIRSNNLLLLRPSPSVLPPIKLIQSLWEKSSQVKLLHCLVDSEEDPKNKNSVIKNVLNSREGFINFSGRLKDGLDFHYYMSQSSQFFRENEFLLTSSDSAYVMKDLSPTQLVKAAEIIARGSFSNCGQNFNSIKRVFVDKEISDQFQTIFLEEAKKFSIHPSLKDESSMTNINEGKLAPFFKKTEFEESQHLLAQLHQKCKEEIVLLEGGKAVTVKKGEKELNFITPAIMRLETTFTSFPYQNQEFMMPICFICPVNSPEHCAEQINSSIFGATASIFTSNPFGVEKLAEIIEVGTVNVNTWQVTDGITYSGRKRSGQGFSFSPLSFNNIVRTKSLSFC